jgi:amino acid transporter
MVMSVVVSGFFGYLLILSLTWVIPNLNSALNARDSSGHPLPAVLAIVEATLGERAGKAVLILTVLAMWFCGLSAVTSISRTIYAFARDRGVPLAKVWSRISPRHQTPAAAIWLSVGLAFAALVYSASYSVVTSISVVGFYLSYIIPVFLGWRRKSQWVEKRGPFSLGSHSNLINGIAVVWTVFVCTLVVMPPNARAGLAILGVIALLFALHKFTGPHEFRRPQWDLTVANSVTSNKDP